LSTRQPNGPRSCYDAGKRFVKCLAMEFARKFKLDVRIACIFKTYDSNLHPRDGAKLQLETLSRTLPRLERL